MKKLEMWRRLLCLVVVAALALATGCDGDGDGGGDGTKKIEQNFETSLHNTRQGKETWFNDPVEGFGNFVNVPYDDLPCVGCHDTRDQGKNDGDPALDSFTDTWPGAPSCQDCHDGEPEKGNVAMPDTCLGCHGRQATEISLGLTDYHMDQLGFDCMNCHTSGDVHGDGNAYSTMFELGAIDAACSDCHDAGELQGVNDFHTAGHMNGMDCSTCHMTTAVACYNCHFDNEGIDDGSVTHSKFASAKFGGAGEKAWRFLVNRVIDGAGNTKIYPGSMQSLMADQAALDGQDDGAGVGFVAIGPYYSHSIQKNAVTCEDCHASAAMQQYVDEGIIDVVKWKGAEGEEVPLQREDEGLTLGTAWQPPKGIIPVPPDYAQALKFEFVDLVDPAAPLTPTATSSSPRVLFKRGADQIHLLDAYVRPLTQAQLDKLGWFNTSLHGTRNGKETFYNDGLGATDSSLLQQGFGNFVTVPYADLPCIDCHNGTDDGPWDAITGQGFEDVWPGNPVCRDCHATENPAAGANVPNDTCKGCHGRLGAEAAIGLEDVHGAFKCTDCHQLSDIHGVTGVEPATMFDEGALTADCRDCHDITASTTLEHTEHAGNITCSACHMESVVTCYNCHFDNEAINDGTVFHAKFASAKFGGPPESGKSWRYLVNRVLDAGGTTMVYPGSMQTLVGDVTSAEFPGEDDQGITFVAIAPYYAHAITRSDALTCLGCHWTQTATDLAGGTPFQVVGWGAAADAEVPASEMGATWQPPRGVIPVTPDPNGLLLFDFVDLVDPAAGPGSARKFFEAGPDIFHVLDNYVLPLSADQMEVLGVRPTEAIDHTAFDGETDCSLCHPLN